MTQAEVDAKILQRDCMNILHKQNKDREVAWNKYVLLKRRFARVFEYHRTHPKWWYRFTPLPGPNEPITHENLMPILGKDMDNKFYRRVFDTRRWRVWNRLDDAFIQSPAHRLLALAERCIADCPRLTTPHVLLCSSDAKWLKDTIKGMK